MHAILFAVLLLVMGTPALFAQTSDNARQLALEIEWVRSPRAVLNGQAKARETPAHAGAMPLIAPVDREPFKPTPQEPTIWSLDTSDQRLSLALARWANQAGWQLVWEAERDFVIESSLHLSGEFLESVATVMQSLSDTDYPLQAKANSQTLTLRINRYRDAGYR